MENKTELENNLFDYVADQLGTHGHVLLDECLPASLCLSLFDKLKSMSLHELNPSEIGRGQARQQQSGIRSDFTSWLDKKNRIDCEYLSWMETLRLAINQRLFLGLFDFEAHYAVYPEGAFYQKHLDSLQGEKNRVLSAVYYLNHNWEMADGGDLLLYQAQEPDKILKRILPKSGRLVLFLSEQFPHEVLVTNKIRYSIAGWFRVR